jgi:hypothetical protein
MEQLELLKLSRETKYTCGDVFRFGLNAREAVSSAIVLRGGQLVGAAFVVVAGSSVA